MSVSIIVICSMICKKEGDEEEKWSVVDVTKWLEGTTKAQASKTRGAELRRRHHHECSMSKRHTGMVS